jgi:hypothetical protein
MSNPAAAGEAGSAGGGGSAEAVTVETVVSDTPIKVTTETPAGEAAPKAEAAAAKPASWRDGISDEYREHPSLKDIGSADELAKAHVNLHKVIGDKRIAMPRNDTPEEFDRFYNEIGTPESPEAYDLKGIMVGERELAADDLGANAMRKSFRERRLSNDQARGVVADWNAIQDQEIAEMTAAHLARGEDTTKALQTGWGVKYPEYMKQAHLAGREFFGGEDGLNELRYKDGSRAVDNKGFIENLQKLGSQMSEDTMAEGKASGMMTPADARTEIKRLKADPEFVKKYLKRTDPEHKAAAALMKSLHAMASPEGGASV